MATRSQIPRILARIPHEELEALLNGYGHKPYFVEGDDPATMHQRMASALEQCINEIRHFSKHARSTGGHRAPALADGRASFAERMDRTERS